MKIIDDRLDKKRITVVTGHYGSGKTEFSVNYALYLARCGYRTALVDLDIANPYFRSREQQQHLAEMGVKVYGNAYGYEITAEIPAVNAAARGPLEDPGCRVVVDAGGDASGARILNQFGKYFSGDDCQVLCVLNRNRPETRDADGAVRHIRSIQAEIDRGVDGLINNTHLLRQTTPEDPLSGFLLCREVSAALGIPLQITCCERRICSTAASEAAALGLEMDLFPIELYMRPDWLDAEVS